MGCAQSNAYDDEAKARTSIFIFLHFPSTLFLNYLTGNDEIENQIKRDRLRAKNEIKMLLLGAGESGKVWFSGKHPIQYSLNVTLVHNPKTDEAHPSWRLYRPGKRLLQRNHLFKYNTIHAVSVHSLDIPNLCIFSLGLHYQRHPRSHANARYSPSTHERFPERPHPIPSQPNRRQNHA